MDEKEKIHLPGFGLLGNGQQERDDRIIEELLKPTRKKIEMEWISVKDRLPTSHGIYEVEDAKGKTFKCIFWRCLYGIPLTIWHNAETYEELHNVIKWRTYD